MRKLFFVVLGLLRLTKQVSRGQGRGRGRQRNLVTYGAGRVLRRLLGGRG
jgi:hypothetical protein